MIETAVSIVQNPNAVPKLGVLRVGEEVERLLVGHIRLLEVILHEVAVAHRGPDVTVIRLQFDDALPMVHGLPKSKNRNNE